jgi:hypothetical protein
MTSRNQHKKRKPAKRPRGRPREDVSPRAAEEICRHLEGGGTLTEWCKKPGRPKPRTVYAWRDKDAEFRARFDGAMQIGTHAMAERALQLALTPMLGERIEEQECDDAEGNPYTRRKVTKEDMLGHRKLAVGTLLRFAAMRAPALYGTKVDVKHDGKITLENLVEQSFEVPADEVDDG